MQISIKSYFEYFPAGPREEAWTFHVSSVGHACIGAGRPYPPPRHPEDRAFTWDRGRVLSALQLVAISKGHGKIEWGTGSKEINAGEVLLLQPGVWHRYRPDPESGWTEDWVELRGSAMEAWGHAGLLDVSTVCLRSNRAFWERFADLHRVCATRPLGYRGIAAGVAMTLLAEVVSAAEQASGPKKGALPELVRGARNLLLDGTEVREVASRLGVSYPTLYRQFKQATGLTPKDYASQVRRARVEDLLAGTDLSVKEVAARLGYHSASHLSLEFKNAHGMSPSRWRVERERR